MAKDFRRKNTTSGQGGISKQFLLVLVCFLMGYLSASIFDLTSLSNWVNSQLLARHPEEIIKTQKAVEAQLPKPKFEFYTLLTKDKSPVSQQPTSVGDPVKPAEVAKTTEPPALPIDLSLTKTAPTSPAEQPAVAVKPQQTLAPVVSSGNYLVQVAAFKSRQEADRVKASLALKGFAASIYQIRQQQVMWYRVVLGPFPSRGDAQKMQESLARTQHLVGMVRKLEA